MGKCILVTGGARSGKSSFSEKKADSYGNKVVYIATAVPFDDEMKERIKKHKESRNPKWMTVESYKNIDEIINKYGQDYKCFLLDCITVMITNQLLEFFHYDVEHFSVDDCDKAENHIKEQIIKMMNAIEESKADAILVTNEVGWGIVPDNPISRLFRDISGRINQIIAQRAEEVYLTVSGIPVRIK
ncbi:MAG: bifunctional adenosylcobinamide kinase/adenosylcobinamide-phosphate guanylyltransferase [Clostridiales bacterium]|nr:bifunctional adenosylcobinamide kinase/adenosylcobinamide-phosphate guanylyltransferase [Clostridiales bacterium]